MAAESGAKHEMSRSRRGRRRTVWTRLTGVLAMVASYAALIAGVLPLGLDPQVREVRLTLLGCAVLCGLLWVIASLCAPPQDVVPPGSIAPRGRPSRSLPFLLALGIPLASAAALVQGVGPDGDHGRWVTEVYAAGGGSQKVPVDRVLGEPRSTGINLDYVDLYTADVMVTLQFAEGPQNVTVRDVATHGVPFEGGDVEVLYAPGNPDLGARGHSPAHFLRSALLIGIWAAAALVAPFVCLVFAMSGDKVHALRGFRWDIHGGAVLLLVAGGCLLLPSAFFWTSLWVSWLLAGAAASTPWLALTWVLKRA